MKLTYRDKVILGIVLAIAIVLGAYFALIKPKNETIKNDSKTLDGLEVTETEYKGRIAQIEPLKTTINEIVAETGKVTEKFVDKDKINNPVKLDKFMQHFAVENEFRISSLAVGDMSETTLPFYYIDAVDIGSGLRSLADINGDYQKEVDANNAEAIQVSAKTASGTLVTQYGVEGRCTKENLWKLMEAIEKYDDTILINSVSFAKADLKEENKNAAPAEGDANTAKANTEEDEEDPSIEPEDLVDAKLVISLYSVYDLPEVKVDEVQ